MLTLIYILILSSIVLACHSFYKQDILKLSPELKKELNDEIWRKKKQTRKAFLFTLPFMPHSLNRLILDKIGRQNLENKLFLAEINLLPEDFLGVKELLILVLFFATAYITKKVTPFSVLLSILIGFFLPDFYLNYKINNQKRLILRAFPDLIDLLSLCIGAGLDFMLGLEWVVERSRPNPLIRELSRVINEIKTGASRHDALKGMAKRLSIPEISSFVNTLVHAERMGAPIYNTLIMLSEETRQKRFERAERLALKAPIKMLFPLIVFILPVVLIIVGGPILLQFLQSDLPKF
ncbi:MAG: type II secretion system F family protein [Candidatus Omnitrophica bacterium]|nr:type II secretion system F family protein [Candidatus Omnitrophota bacterium]